MRNVVLTYPTLTSAVSSYIRSVRNEHDDHAKVVEPHVTLVFPWVPSQPSIEEEHITRTIRKNKRFRACFRKAVSYSDRLSADTYAFLIPEEGHSDFLELHSQLYAESLSKHKVEDVAYLPHIRLGDFHSAKGCEELVEAVNSKQMEAWTDINELHLA